MEVLQNMPLMNAGDGESSYANNSVLQKVVILNVRSLLEKAVKNAYNESFSKCFKVADMGCSSGPNTFMVISTIIETIHSSSLENNRQPPELIVYLNDLPNNDFNTVFKMLPMFYQSLKKENGQETVPSFVSAMPGSFYARIFPSNSLDFVHSSNSLHWLSQVPKRLDNKGSVYISRTSPPEVAKAYLKQFQSDFSTFLSLRSEEMKHGGRMILTLAGRRNPGPICEDCSLWDMLSESLLELASEGLIREEDVDSFNAPFYKPHEEEIKVIIEEEKSWSLEKIEVFEDDWDTSDANHGDNLGMDMWKSGNVVANRIRAITEPILASHFGGIIIEDLFGRYVRHVADYLCLKKIKNTSIVIILRKKNIDILTLETW